MAYQIKMKRIYAPQEPEDGMRILVDRLWPRGIRKENAGLDAWLKNVAPSNELRKSFAHQPERFPEFREAYRRELEANPDALSFAESCKEASAGNPITLLYAAKDEAFSNASVLLEWLLEL